MNSMRTRKGGGKCETHYCTAEQYPIPMVSHRVYEKYLDFKKLSDATPLAEREKHLPVSMDDIMKFLKIDCKENGGDRLCFGSKTFDNGWYKRNGTRQTSTFPYKRVSFEEIAKHAERSITSFLMGITMGELDIIRGKEVEEKGVGEMNLQDMMRPRSNSGGSKRKRKRTKRR